MPGLLAIAATALLAQGPDEGRGDRLVKVELLADRSAIRPGDAFSLAVRFSIEPGWHVYWENAGDSGYPTRASVSGPAGFTLSPPRFPSPARHEAEGDIVTYVHEGELVLVVDAKAPDAPVPGAAKAAFSVDARWLVCTDVCFGGTGRASLEIPIADTGAKPAPANEKLFADARARLPRPWSELAGASIDWRPAEAVLAVPGATGLELYPLHRDRTTLEGWKVERADGGCRLVASFAFEPRAPDDLPVLAGVLRVRKEAGEICYRFESVPSRPR